MFLDRKIPYQFGDPKNGDSMIFDCNDLLLSYKPSVKTERVASRLFDGEARLNGDEPNKRDSTQIQISFSLLKGTPYTETFLLSLFSNSPRKLFVYMPIDGGNGYKVMWQYAECVSLPQVVSGTEITSEEYERYTVTMLLANPEFYECDETLGYFVPAQLQYKFTTPASFEFLNTGAIDFGAYEINSFPSFGALSPTDQGTILKEGKRLLSVKDKYFAVEDYQITTDFITITLSTPIYVTSEGLDLLTSAVSEVYVIKFESLSQDEYIQVTNLSTNSDIKITWLGSTSSSISLLFVSTNNILYDPDSQTEIDPTLYAIDSDTNTQLYFNKHTLSSNNPFLEVQTETDNLKLQSTSTNQLQIQTLKSYI